MVSFTTIVLTGDTFISGGTDVSAEYGLRGVGTNGGVEDEGRLSLVCVCKPACFGCLGCLKGV